MSFLAALEAVCRRQPEHPALIAAGQNLDYASLWRQVQALGSGLQAQGIQPGDMVAIGYGRSPEFVLALLACWHAGAIWLPCADLPEGRRQQLLSEARPRLILGPRQPDLPLGALQAQPLRPVHVPAPGDPAYLIYTSGSSGRPKGVLLPHAGIVPMLRAQIECFGLGATSRSLWLLSPLFDASLSDIGTALLSGAALVIDPDPLASLDHFYRLLHEHAVSYLDLPPSLLSALDPAGLPASLETLVIGGEVADPIQVGRWAEQVRLINVYGPTEATVCTSAGVCRPGQPAGLLGQPLAGIVYTLDGEAPYPGRQGELWIHGPGLALGYWEQPELSAERFVSHAGRRWYRSGDRVEYTAEGEYRFLGRLDRQFKHNGRLICPEEIEAALKTHSAVAMAVIVRHSCGALTACLAGNPQAQAELPAHLAPRLPAWMIPNLWLWPQPWPLTPSGKTDTGALVHWALAADAGPGAALTPGESLLADIWEKLLGQPVHDPEADYLALGGSSVQVLACVALAAEAGLVLSPESFYRERRLGRIARQAGLSQAISAAELRTRLPAPLEAKSPLARPIDTLLLTGGTGFLGSRLLAELLTQTGWKLQCLVRAGSQELGWKRLEQALQPWGQVPDPARIEVLCGDLARSDLGLPDTDILAP
ncbi:MAG TPA: AMP-binding protein, partial [Candidatus Obscuribacterales bacterium]